MSARAEAAGPRKALGNSAENGKRARKNGDGRTLPEERVNGEEVEGNATPTRPAYENAERMRTKQTQNAQHAKCAKREACTAQSATRASRETRCVRRAKDPTGSELRHLFVSAFTRWLPSRNLLVRGMPSPRLRSG